MEGPPWQQEAATFYCFVFLFFFYSPSTFVALTQVTSLSPREMLGAHAFVMTIYRDEVSDNENI